MRELYNIDIEKTILSSLIYFSNDELNATDYNPYNAISSSDFYLPTFQNIHKIILSFIKEGFEVDEYLLKDRINQNIKKESERIIMEDTIVQIITTTPTLELKLYIDKVKEKSLLRKLLSIANQTIGEIDEHSDPYEILNNLKSKMEYAENEIDEYEGQEISGEELLNKYSDVESIIKVKTNIPFWDIPLRGGFGKGGLTIIAGPPECGKTHIAYNIVESSSLTGLSGVISLEFGEDLYSERLKKFKTNGIKFNEKNMKFNFDCFSLPSLVKQLYKFSKKGVEIVVIDSLHEITVDDKRLSPSDKIDLITQTIKRVAKKTNMSIILIALGSKEDYNNNRMGVLNSSLASHAPRIFIRISEDKHKNRYLHWHKNKETKLYPNTKLRFHDNGLITEYIDGKQFTKKTKISLTLQ